MNQLHVVEEWVPKISRKIGSRHLCQIFGIYLMIFQTISMAKIWHKMKKKKALFTGSYFHYTTVCIFMILLTFQLYVIATIYEIILSNYTFIYRIIELFRWKICQKMLSLKSWDYEKNNAFNFSLLAFQNVSKIVKIFVKI